MYPRPISISIRKADSSMDSNPIWNIFSSIISTGDTFVFGPNTSKNEFAQYWFDGSAETYTCLNEEGEILGSYILKPNQLGYGSHIANGSYMVNPEFQGRGIGKILGNHSINRAREIGYLGIQFNIVVSTNIVGIKLWKSLGFDIIGTTPRGFRHKDLGLVDSYIMFLDLSGS